MSQSVLNSDVFVNGNLSAASFNCPSGAISDANVVQSANIQATKLTHQFAVRYDTVTGTAISAQTMPVHIVNAAAGATVAAVKMTVQVAPSSSDTVVVGVQRSTGGGSFSSILTSTVTFNNASTAKTVVSASLATTTLLQNDLINVVVSGTNSSAQALMVEIFLRENAV